MHGLTEAQAPRPDDVKWPMRLRGRKIKFPERSVTKGKTGCSVHKDTTAAAFFTPTQPARKYIIFLAAAYLTEICLSVWLTEWRVRGNWLFSEQWVLVFGITACRNNGMAPNEYQAALDDALCTMVMHIFGRHVLICRLRLCTSQWAYAFVWLEESLTHRVQ